MVLRRLIIAVAAAIAAMVPLTILTAPSAGASTGILCNTTVTAQGRSWFWPCMQIHGYGNTVYNIAMWAHTPSSMQIPSELGDFPVSEHLELTGPGGEFLMNTPSFVIGPGQNSAAYYWLTNNRGHYAASGWYCVTGWYQDFETGRSWYNGGHTCGLVHS